MSTDQIPLKDVARVFWLVKNHLVDEQTMRQSYDGYFKRIWGNHEICYREEGFEEAFTNYQQKGS